MSENNTTADTGELYDAHYYETGCGVAYDRAEHWEKFFGIVADRIVSEIGPRTVLDAGCASGYLVKALRERGVEAWGVDISEYAIAHAPEAARPFVRVGSVTEPFERRYDLIVCIEVLEHLHKPNSEQAIANLCAHADDIVFSSSPLDYKEATHFNVQPPEYWAEHFARHGLFHDVEFDAGFITPWAMRLRKLQNPSVRLAKEFERRWWTLQHENTELRAMVVELRETETKLRESESQLREESHRAAQRAEEERRQSQSQQAALAAENASLKNLVDGYRNGKVMRLMQGVHETRHKGRAAAAALVSAVRRDGLTSAAKRGARLAQTGGAQALATAAGLAPDAAYAAWIAQNEPTPAQLAAQRDEANRMTDPPLISVVMPTFNTPAPALRAALDSLVAQTYPHWEACVADGASDHPDTRAILREYAARDPRIRLRLLDANAGISGNSNAALEMARGEFAALLDHDDTLAPNALYEVAWVILNGPACDLIYSDHDVLSADGARRSHPLFKPGWSPDVMLSSCYITHLTVARVALARELGGFRPAVDGAQDWDLFLRMAERGGGVAHIPKMLYHWRNAENSTAMNIYNKEYAVRAQLQVIQEHLSRVGLKEPHAFFDASGFLRASWQMERQPLVSIIIPTRGAPAMLKRCVKVILAQTRYPSYEIVIINNGPARPEAIPWFAEATRDPRVRVVHHENAGGVFNYSAVCNFGARQARGELLLFLNNDTEPLAPDWLDELCLWAVRPEIGVTGAKLLRPNGKIQHAGVVIGLTGFAGHLFADEPEGLGSMIGFAEWYRNVSAVTGACQIFRREVFEALGGYDEQFVQNGSDVAICLKAQERNLRVVVNPFARLAHAEHASVQSHIPPADFAASLRAYEPRLKTGDPFFNPGLSYWHVQPALRQPDEPSPLDFARAHAEKLNSGASKM